MTDKNSEKPSGSAFHADDGFIKIKLGERVYQGNYLDDLKISEADINTMLETQPSRYVFWAKMAAIAKVLVEKWKYELEKYEAQTYTFIRSQKESRGERVTEKQLQSAIVLDPRFRQLRERLLKARLQYDHLAAIKEAFAQRKDMLMSLGANLREEMDTTLALREKELSERRLRNLAKRKQPRKG